MSIPGSASPLFFQAAAAAAADQVATRSVRFNADDSARLTRTFGSGGNRKTWTWSGWFKRHKSESMTNMLFACYVNSSNRFYIGIQGGSDKLLMFGRVGGSDSLEILSDQVFRDFGAWYHMVVAIDSTQGSSSNRVKVYVNGTQISLATTTALAQNGEPYLNAAVEHHLGFLNGSSKLNAYMADVYFIDGSQLDATSFGEFDSNGVWQAKAASGLTFGTNGYHLKFEDTSSNAAIGTDSSGNSNTFTVHNLYASTAAAVDYSTGQVTGSESGFVSGYGPDKMFDGSLSTLTDQVDTGNTGEAGYLYWNPSTAVSVSSKLRIYGRWYVSSIGNQYLISDEVSINGNSYTAPGDGTTSNQWVDLSSYLSSNSITSITNISFRSNPTSSNRLDPAIAAIEVDDTILVNSAATDGDVMFDAPTNGTQSDTGAGGEVSGNYCVFNPLSSRRLGVLSDGNLKTVFSSDSTRAEGTIAVKSGKFYWEAKAVTNMNTHTIGGRIGICKVNSLSITSAENVEFDVDWHANAGVRVRRQGYSSVSLATGTNYVDGDFIGVALDVSNSTVKFYKNGSLAYNIDFSSYLTAGEHFLTAHAWGYFTSTWEYNFGAKPFKHAAPSGYKTLNSANLDTPAVADGSDHFETKIFTGNGSSTTLTTSFSPDLVWLKSRTSSFSHYWADTIRGKTKLLRSNSNAGEITSTTGVTSFNSDGVTLGSGSETNANNDNMVAWLWDFGSSTVSNTDGSVTSNVRASQTSGTSIVQYTGTSASTNTVGHGLNAQPHFIMLKANTETDNWFCYHIGTDTSSPEDYDISLNTTGARRDYDTWNDTKPTNSVFSVGNTGASNENGRGYIAYCFAPVTGFSAFGRFNGTSSTDGAFVYTGFKVAWYMVKQVTGSGENWRIIDSTRAEINVAERRLLPNSTATEGAQPNEVDFLSNGFKFRSTDGAYNSSGHAYIYAAFASNPLSSNGGLAR